MIVILTIDMGRDIDDDHDDDVGGWSVHSVCNQPAVVHSFINCKDGLRK